MQSTPNEGNADRPSHRPDGSFAPGNKLGRGNPNGKHWARLRQRVIDLGKECPAGMSEDARERMLANELWSMALGSATSEDALGIKRRISTRDQLHAMEIVIATYGGKRALQGDTEDHEEGSVDPEEQARQACDRLRTLGLEALIPPGMAREV